MSANVEAMFSVRELPWHGLGTVVQDAPTSKDAIIMAGLDWEVDQRPIYDIFGKEIPKYKANTRETDNSILGIVTDKYKIVQNSEAFEFTDNLINDDVKYETAGSLKNGKTIWLLAKMPERNILNDKFDPYICFTNTHDGTGSVKVLMTPIRVVCNNTLNMALDTAKRSWSTKHMGNMETKLEEARQTLGLANIYMDELDKKANELVVKKISDNELEAVFDSLYPVDKNKDSERKIQNIEQLKANLFRCYDMPDISAYRGTVWGVINAATDLAAHVAPARMTNTYKENNWSKIMSGHPFVDNIYSKIAA